MTCDLCNSQILLSFATEKPVIPSSVFVHQFFLTFVFLEFLKSLFTNLSKAL